MSLSAYIRDHHEEIVREFAAFARTLMPPGVDMSEEQLRDHAEDILTAVVHDMSIAQTSNEQTLKSHGHGSVETMQASGRLHADNRVQHGFRSGRCSRNFARSARPSFDCTRKAVRSISAK